MRILTLTSLAPADIAAVRHLVRSADGAADNPPISESGLLKLAEPGTHLLARSAGQHRDTSGDDASTGVLGYAQLDRSEQPPAAELVAVDVPTARALIDAVLQVAPQARLWAHGEASVARRAADAAGLVPVRTLLQLRAGLAVDEAPTPPPGVTVQAFRPGQDDAAWLAVNARAFASHPEQGTWTQHDLQQRIDSDWFDPAGFLLAWRGAELLGYHWTKIHRELQPAVGEVYVLGVDPDAQGLGLGSVLLQAGLHWLNAQGLTRVLLYVEQDNQTAVRLYRKAGFDTFATDVQYSAS